jgi:hypothetical protein
MRTVGTKELLLLFCYILLFITLRELSLSHWLLSSGLRFAALLFFPFRYWPYIFLGDCAGSLYYRVDHLHEFGPAWLALSVLLPPLAAMAPIAHLRASHRWQDTQPSLSASALQLLQTAGLTSLLIAMGAVGALLAIKPGAQPPKESPLFYLCDYTLGNYLGILMIAPAAMTWSLGQRREYKAAAAELRASLSQHAASVAAMSAVLALLLVVNLESAFAELQRTAATLMLAPVVWMTFRRGWIGAVPATMLASIALELTMRSYRDFDQLQNQALLGLVSSGILLLGAKLTENQLKVTTLDRVSLLHKRLARQNLLWGESRMRQSAGVIERTFSVFQTYVDDATLQLHGSKGAQAGALARWSAPGVVRAGSDLKHVIATLDARPLDARGIRVALAYGPLSETLKQAGISYSIRAGHDLNDLPSDMQLIIYRITYDLALYMAKEYSAYKVAARLCTYRTDTKNVALVVKAWPSLGDQPSLPPSYWDLETVEGIADTFDGIYHNRRRRRRPTIGVLLRKPQ